MTSQDSARLRLDTERERTLARIAGLEAEFDAIAASVSRGTGGGDDEHDPEGATVAFERQHVAALLSAARGQLTAIDAALRKVDSGGYELCDRCGGPIGAERLAARPSALTCVRCAGGRR